MEGQKAELRNEQIKNYKLVMLKSGEDIICDLKEMVLEGQVIGYYFYHPFTINTRESDKNNGMLEVRLLPWVPFSQTHQIPVVVDWVVTIVDPVEELAKMYEKEVETYERRIETDSSN